jgi:hypothetical protein
MRRCPHALIRHPETDRLLPYLNRYYCHGEYPNGKGMLYQTIGLTTAIDVYLFYMDKYKADYLKKISEQ